MTRKRVDVYHHRGSERSKGELKKCGLCRGSGRDMTKSVWGEKCSTCGGTGWVRV